MALKIAKAFDVSVDFLIGQGVHAAYDRETMKRMEDIQRLDEKDKEHVTHSWMLSYLNAASKKIWRSKYWSLVKRRNDDNNQTPVHLTSSHIHKPAYLMLKN